VAESSVLPPEKKGAMPSFISSHTLVTTLVLAIVGTVRELLLVLDKELHRSRNCIDPISWQVAQGFAERMPS
jgi:hypothetical protein